MRSARVIIGANFGDEGKGKVTDYYASKLGENTLVIRFNGGAQAGHTVLTPKGKRHIFSHFGSGTLAGAKTYLSKFFVVNPIIFRREFKELKDLGVEPQVFVDGDCFVTTPYDMILNQLLEESRGLSRHGSCGIGFNETIERSLRNGYKISVSDGYEISDKLKDIQNGYLPKRLKELNIREVFDKWNEVKTNPNIISHYLEDLEFFRDNVIVSDPEWFRRLNLIFEGSQGLMLDEDYGYFPHVTRSRTGLSNVCKLVSDFGIDFFNITYVTRPYITRHGKGPLHYELNGAPYSRVEDKTNICNKYQGPLRFAILDLDSFIVSM